MTITLDKSCGCTGDFTQEAIALYGVRAIFTQERYTCHNTFDLVPTYAQIKAIDAETETRFRDVLNGENGFIDIARLLFKEHEGFYMAEEEFTNYHKEPTCIFDWGRMAFWAWKRGGYVYITWAMYNKPLNFDEATRWARIKHIHEWRKEGFR